MNTFNVAVDSSLVRKAMNFDMSDVKSRFKNEHSAPDSVVNELEKELKRFLILCSISSASSYGMRGPVDDLWHTFVIFTKQYFTFCEGVAGKYLHHTPYVEGKSKEQIVQEENDYNTFLADYQRFFNEEAPSHVWPQPVRVFAEQGCAGGCSMNNDDDNNSGNTGGWGSLELVA